MTKTIVDLVLVSGVRKGTGATVHRTIGVVLISLISLSLQVAPQHSGKASQW